MLHMLRHSVCLYRLAPRQSAFRVTKALHTYACTFEGKLKSWIQKQGPSLHG